LTVFNENGAVVKYASPINATMGPRLMTTSDLQSVRKTRWYKPTVGKFLLALVASQVVLYLSQYYKWFWFNQFSGHTVVITVAATAIGLLLIAGIVVLGL
jgi:hypothetical protein